MIKTLYISNLIIVYIIYFTHIVHIDVFWCFSLLLKSKLLAAGKVSSPTIFDLQGWNTHHFVWNLIAYTAKWPKKQFFICFQKKITQNHKQLCKNIKFWENLFKIFFYILFFKNSKKGLFCAVPSLRKWNKKYKFYYICEIVEQVDFSAEHPKNSYFLCESFNLRFTEKV